MAEDNDKSANTHNNPFETMGALRDRLRGRIWDSDTRDMSWPRAFAVNVARIFLAILRDIAEGQISLRAMSLVYTTLLSLVPLLAISFSVLKGFGVHNQIEPMLLHVLEPLGEKSAEITQKIIQFVDNIQVGVLGAAGLALLIFSVVSLMQKIERAFNYIWQVSEARSFTARFSDYLSVLLIGPLLIFLSMGITTSLTAAPWIENLAGYAVFDSAMTMFATVVPWLLYVLAFSFIYVYMPNTRVRVGAAVVGGAVAGFAWKLLGFLFKAFVAGSANYAAIYSAFATLILFMIWLYLGWLVLLTGSSIAYYVQYPGSQNIPRQGVRLSPRVREKLALVIVRMIGARFYEDKGAIDVRELSSMMRVPYRVVASMLDALVRGGILAHSDKGFLPGQPFEKTYVSELYEVVRADGEGEGLKFERIPPAPGIDEMLAESSAAGCAPLGKITLKDLVDLGAGNGEDASGGAFAFMKKRK